MPDDKKTIRGLLDNGEKQDEKKRLAINCKKLDSRTVNNGWSQKCELRIAEIKTKHLQTFKYLENIIIENRKCDINFRTGRESEICLNEICSKYKVENFINNKENMAERLCNIIRLIH